jgi:sulfate transport system permease protein
LPPDVWPLFITFPLSWTVQPVLCYGPHARRCCRYWEQVPLIFWRITLPTILPHKRRLLSFARAIGEFGSVVIVAGNIPFFSQTAAVYLLGEVESENRLGASAVSIVMIAIAFGLMLLVDWLQHGDQRHAK